MTIYGRWCQACFFHHFIFSPHRNLLELIIPSILEPPQRYKDVLKATQPRRLGSEPVCSRCGSPVTFHSSLFRVSAHSRGLRDIGEGEGAGKQEQIWEEGAIPGGIFRRISERPLDQVLC